MVLGLGDVLTHETGVQRVLKSVKGDALPLPDNPSDSVNEGRLTQTLEAKDLKSPMSGRTVWNRKNGGARVDQIVSGRVWTPGGVRAEERKVGFVAITPTIKLFSAGNGDLFFTGANDPGARTTSNTKDTERQAWIDDEGQDCIRRADFTTD